MEPNGEVFLGVSAGLHKGHKHPHSETLRDIRSVRLNSQILATNVCANCIFSLPLPKEYHQWYDTFLEEERKSKKKIKAGAAETIDFFFDRYTYPLPERPAETYGLFAFIFEIPSDKMIPIEVRLALSKKVEPAACFYGKHPEKLAENCTLITTDSG